VSEPDLRCSGRETDPLEESPDFTGHECFRQCLSLERSRAPSFIVEGLRGAFFNGLGWAVFSPMHRSHCSCSSPNGRARANVPSLTTFLYLFSMLSFLQFIQQFTMGGFPLHRAYYPPSAKATKARGEGGGVLVRGIGVAMSREAHTSRGAEPV